jgi:hypothetical protein
MRRLSLLVLAVVPACVIYSPGSFDDTLSPFIGKRVELRCLDLALALTDDARATAPVIAYSFGNHCATETIVDLSTVRVLGRYPDGTARPLVAYDPRHEIVPLQLDAWWRGHEQIEYRPTLGTVQPTVVCADVGKLDRDRSPPHGERWICLGASDDGGAP